MAGRIITATKCENFLTRGEIATQMSEFVKNLDPDAEIKEERVVEVPTDGCPGHITLGEWKTWCARWGEFLVVAIDATGVEATVSLH